MLGFCVAYLVIAFLAMLGFANDVVETPVLVSLVWWTGMIVGSLVEIVKFYLQKTGRI